MPLTGLNLKNSIECVAKLCLSECTPASFLFLAGAGMQLGFVRGVPVPGFEISLKIDKYEFKNLYPCQFRRF